MKFLSLFLLCFCWVGSALAEDDLSKKADAAAQKVIDACWAVSQEDRDSGVTSRMRAGSLKTALCMEDHILMLSEKVLFKEDKEIQKEVAADLKSIHHGIGGFYWHLHNGHDACGKSPCGTMYHVFHNSILADYMEKILKDTYQKIYDDDYYQPAMKKIEKN